MRFLRCCLALLLVASLIQGPQSLLASDSFAAKAQVLDRQALFLSNALSLEVESFNGPRMLTRRGFGIAALAGGLGVALEPKLRALEVFTQEPTPSIETTESNIKTLLQHLYDTDTNKRNEAANQLLAMAAKPKSEDLQRKLLILFLREIERAEAGMRGAEQKGDQASYALQQDKRELFFDLRNRLVDQFIETDFLWDLFLSEPDTIIRAELLTLYANCQQFHKQIDFKPLVRAMADSRTQEAAVVIAKAYASKFDEYRNSILWTIFMELSIAEHGHGTETISRLLKIIPELGGTKEIMDALENSRMNMPISVTHRVLEIIADLDDVAGYEKTEKYILLSQLQSYVDQEPAIRLMLALPPSEYDIEAAKSLATDLEAAEFMGQSSSAGRLSKTLNLLLDQRGRTQILTRLVERDGNADFTVPFRLLADVADQITVGEVTPRLVDALTAGWRQTATQAYVKTILDALSKIDPANRALMEQVNKIQEVSTLEVKTENKIRKMFQDHETLHAFVPSLLMMELFDKDLFESVVDALEYPAQPLQRFISEETSDADRQLFFQRLGVLASFSKFPVRWPVAMYALKMLEDSSWRRTAIMVLGNCNFLGWPTPIARYAAEALLRDSTQGPLPPDWEEIHRNATFAMEQAHKFMDEDQTMWEVAKQYGNSFGMVEFLRRELAHADPANEYEGNGPINQASTFIAETGIQDNDPLIRSFYAAKARRDNYLNGDTPHPQEDTLKQARRDLQYARSQQLVHQPPGGDLVAYSLNKNLSRDLIFDILSRDASDSLVWEAALHIAATLTRPTAYLLEYPRVLPLLAQAIRDYPVDSLRFKSASAILANALKQDDQYGHLVHETLLLSDRRFLMTTDQAQSLVTLIGESRSEDVIIEALQALSELPASQRVTLTADAVKSFSRILSDPVRRIQFLPALNHITIPDAGVRRSLMEALLSQLILNVASADRDGAQTIEGILMSLIWDQEVQSTFREIEQTTLDLPMAKEAGRWLDVIRHSTSNVSTTHASALNRAA
jgi:hypothetical protein